MSIRNTLLATVAVVALGAGAAQAQTAPKWSGFYVGLNAGLGSLSSSVSNSTPLANITDYTWFYNGANQARSSNATSVVGTVGATIGYNHSIPNSIYVVGVEADYAGAFGRARARSTDWGVDYPTTTSSSLTSFGTLRVRAGATVGNALIYATGGLAFGTVQTTIRDLENYYTTGDGGYGYSRTRMQAGWTMGGGVEMPVAERISLKGEALYYDLGANTGTNTRALSGASYYNGAHYQASTTGVMARVGLNYAF